MPERIQRSRQHPWRAEHPDAVIVDRTSKWGNPYRVIDLIKRSRELGAAMSPAEASELVVEMFRADLTHGPDSPYWWFGPHMQIITIKSGLQAGELRGLDLACWCKPSSPCHADVLLELANA